MESNLSERDIKLMEQMNANIHSGLELNKALENLDNLDEDIYSHERVALTALTLLGGLIRNTEHEESLKSVNNLVGKYPSLKTSFVESELHSRKENIVRSQKKLLLSLVGRFTSDKRLLMHINDAVDRFYELDMMNPASNFHDEISYPAISLLNYERVQLNDTDSLRCIYEDLRTELVKPVYPPEMYEFQLERRRVMGLVVERFETVYFKGSNREEERKAG